MRRVHEFREINSRGKQISNIIGPNLKRRQQTGFVDWRLIWIAFLKYEKPRIISVLMYLTPCSISIFRLSSINSKTTISLPSQTVSLRYRRALVRWKTYRKVGGFSGISTGGLHFAKRKWTGMISAVNLCHMHSWNRTLLSQFYLNFAACFRTIKFAKKKHEIISLHSALRRAKIENLLQNGNLVAGEISRG